jgi:type IV pilus assembly protein PilV
MLPLKQTFARINISQASMYSQAGATLIEAMVSLFVFAVGALGLAALQTTALIQSDDTKQRTLAVWKGQELIERMLSTRTFANSDGLMSQFVTQIGNTSAPPSNGIGIVGVQNNLAAECGSIELNCSVDTCTPSQLVSYEISDIFCDDSTGLSTSELDADGSIALKDIDVALRKNGQIYELYIEWQARTADREAASNGVTNGLTGTIDTNLCGTTVALDARVNAICWRFQ